METKNNSNLIHIAYLIILSAFIVVWIYQYIEDTNEKSKLNLEINQTSKELNDLKSEIEELKKTDAYYLQKAGMERAEGRFDESNKMISSLIDRFPNSGMIDEATKMFQRNINDMASQELEYTLNIKDKQTLLDALLELEKKYNNTDAAIVLKKKINETKIDLKKEKEEDDKAIRNILSDAKKERDPAESNRILRKIKDYYPNAVYPDEVNKLMDSNYEKIREIELDSTYVLETISFKWGSTGSYAKARGQVKNRTNVPIENIEAVVTLYDKDDNYISHGSAMIEYDPLMPNQISPFNVYVKYNPVMEKAHLEFKLLMGPMIPTKYSHNK